MSKLQSFWQGKSVFITGASSGLGWAITEALAPFGVHLGLVSRRIEKLNELAAKLSQSGSSFWVRACDVQEREQVQSAISDFADESGQLDVVWANSGISRDSSHDAWKWENFEALIDTNVKGVVYTIQPAVEIMDKQGFGTLVGTGSAAAMRGLPGRGVYSLTKVALEYYMLSWAAELPHLQFSIIHPGFVDTPINQNNPNRFWLQTPESAARRMIKAVAKRKKILIFPSAMAGLFHLVRHLPLPVYMPIARRLAQFTRPSQPQKSNENPR